jgi:hypothetical protein
MFFGHNLARSTTPNLLSDGVAAGSGDTQNSTALDMAEDQGVHFTVVLGTVAAGGSGTIKIQMSADNNVADPWTDVAGSAQSYTSTNSAHAFVADIFKPQRRYLRVVVIRGAGGNTTIQSIVALQYHVGVAPENPGTNFDGVLWLANPGPGAP